MITIGNICVDFIKGFEGFRSEPYQGETDRPGVYTVGYGTIRYPSYYLGGKAVELTDAAISEEQASDFLRDYIVHTCYYIDPYLRDDLSENQFAALASFVYNLGAYALKTSTLLQKVNANKLDIAIRDEFMRWVHANGVVVEGLKRRRKAEADLYFTP